MIYHQIQSAYLDYLQHLADGGERQVLPPDERSEADFEAVYASSLGGCPLQNAYRWHGIEPTHPKSEAERVSRLHLMQQGVRDAEPLQEALLWKYGDGWQLADETPDGVGVERSIASASHQIRGRADVILKLDGEQHVVEIKRRDPFRGKLEPKLSDAFQIMAYLMVSGIPYGHILVLNRYFFKLWTLTSTSQGYTLTDEAGQPWTADENTPNVLNFETVRAEIHRQLHYQRALSEGRALPTPIADPVNDPQGWLCVTWVERPKAYKTRDNKPGAIKPNCEWNCHFRPSEPEVEVVIGEDGQSSARFDLNF